MAGAYFVLAILAVGCASSSRGPFEGASEQPSVSRPEVSVTLVPTNMGRVVDCGSEPNTSYTDAVQIRADRFSDTIDQSKPSDVLRIRLAFKESPEWVSVAPAKNRAVTLNGVALRLAVTSPAEFFSTRTGFTNTEEVRSALSKMLAQYGTTQSLRSANQRRVSENLLAKGQERGAAGAQRKANDHEVNSAVADRALKQLNDGSLELLGIAVSGPTAELVDYLAGLSVDVHDLVVVEASRNGSLLQRAPKGSFTTPTGLDEMFGRRPMLPLPTQLELWGGFVNGCPIE